MILKLGNNRPIPNNKLNISYRNYAKHCFIILLETNDIDDEESTTLEVWVIVLVVILPILAVVIMLSIGMYCACTKRYVPNKDLELLPRTSSSSRASFNQ